jgi:hypothetical protein
VLGCAAATVREWRRRFIRGGIPALADRARSGRPEVYGPDVRLAIVATATSLPPEGTSAWTHALIAARLPGTGISASQTGRILAGLELQPHRVRGWLNRADDPRFWAQAAAVCDAWATRAWIAAHPRITVTYTPKHASWLDMAELWFSILTRALLRRGDFTSRAGGRKPARAVRQYDAGIEAAAAATTPASSLSRGGPAAYLLSASIRRLVSSSTLPVLGTSPLGELVAQLGLGQALVALAGLVMGLPGTRSAADSAWSRTTPVSVPAASTHLTAR